MATGEDGSRPHEVSMPRPSITTDPSAADVCEILATEGRREIIKKVAMRDWVSIDELDPYAVVALEERGVVRVRGHEVERGEHFASVLETLNDRAIERRESR